MNTDNSVKIVDLQEPEVLDPVTLTASAVKHVTRKIAERAKGVGIRLGVKTAGCSGLKYVLDYEDETDPTSYCFTTTNPDIFIFVDKKSYPFVKGTEIDYIEDKFNAHFVYNNPLEKNACGCGESFNIE